MSETETKKPRTMDEMSNLIAAGEDAVEGIPRFIPSGITNPAYNGTRIRRFQRNQTTAVVAGLDKFSVRTKQELIDNIEGNSLLRHKATQFVQSCLVGKEKPVGSAQLFRKGATGLSRLLQDLSPKTVAEVLCKACDQVGVLQNPEVTEEGTEQSGADETPESDDGTAETIET